MSDPFDALASATNEESPVADSPDAELAALRAELDDARPRLEAFAALEALAEEQNSTPEAIALQASLEMLESAVADAERERDQLIERRDTLRTEIVEAMDEHTEIVEQVAEMIDELEAIRADAVRLLGEKSTLEAKLEGLRGEVGELEVTHGDRAAAIVDDADEATAFDAFFEAEVVEDKARAWMLE